MLGGPQDANSSESKYKSARDGGATNFCRRSTVHVGRRWEANSRLRRRSLRRHKRRIGRGRTDAAASVSVTMWVPAGLLPRALYEPCGFYGSSYHLLWSCNHAVLEISVRHGVRTTHKNPPAAVIAPNRPRSQQRPAQGHHTNPLHAIARSPQRCARPSRPCGGGHRIHASSGPAR